MQKDAAQQWREIDIRPDGPDLRNPYTDVDAWALSPTPVDSNFGAQCSGMVDPLTGCGSPRPCQGVSGSGRVYSAQTRRS
jgi:hypothetical protein